MFTYKRPDDGFARMGEWRTQMDGVMIDTEAEYAERMATVDALPLPSRGAAHAYVPLSDIVSRFTYKPGWRFTVHYGGMPVGGPSDLAATVAVHTPRDVVNSVPSPSRGEELLSVQNIVGIPRDATEAEVVRRVRECVRKLELHESDEWLRYDGGMVAEPHTGLWREGRDKRRGWKPPFRRFVEWREEHTDL